MAYRNLPLIWKVTLLLVALGLVSLGSALYSTSNMTGADHKYSELLGSEAKAQVFLERANRYLTDELAGIYLTIAAGDDATVAQAKGVREKAVEGYQASIAEAGRKAPDYADRTNALAEDFRTVMKESCARPVEIVAKSNDGVSMVRALGLMGSACEPALRKLSAKLLDLTTVIEKDTDSEAVRLTAHNSSTATVTLAAIGGGTLFLLLLAVVLVRGGIVRPIAAMIAATGDLGHGKLGQQVPGTERKDEIGAMANALEVLRTQLAAAEAVRLEQAQREEQDRTRIDARNRLAQTFVQRMTDLASAFAASSDELAGSARTLSMTADETSQQARNVADAAQDAASNVQTVAASSEELAASVREITSQVAQSAQVADTAFQEVERSNRRITELSRAATAIGDVISLIRGIADQTNLLALNATIESARAGEAGRGFAVVASEVKELATQTAKATEDISQKIAEVQNSTGETVNSMAEIMRVISNMKQISSSIAGAVEQQGAATAEIAHNCQRAADGTQNVTRNISGVGQAAAMTGTSSGELLSLSEGLSRQAADLKQVVETFVMDLRAA